jgi:ABC transporter, phosphonate, periplasmic substrate-binding protein
LLLFAQRPLLEGARQRAVAAHEVSGAEQRFCCETLEPGDLVAAAQGSQARLHQHLLQTSYFSTSILLARDGLALNDFFDAFAVPPWQGQIDAVVDGQIDATMVYEDVWLPRPSNAAETRVIARLDDLPTPLVIALTGLDAAFTSKLTTALIAYEPKPAPGMLYAGFAATRTCACAASSPSWGRFRGFWPRAPPNLRRPRTRYRRDSPRSRPHIP